MSGSYRRSPIRWQGPSAATKTASCPAAVRTYFQTMITRPLPDLEEAARPTMPPIPGATDADRRQGTQLAAIHRHYLMEMGRIDMVFRRIEAGDAPPPDLAQIVLSTDTARNLAATGTICGQSCQMLMAHHNIEEGHMFPELAGQPNEALRAVVAKLRAEHEVIHALLLELHAAAQALVATPTEATFAAARTAFDRLHGAIRSHFGYEETELAEAIGFYLDGI